MNDKQEQQEEKSIELLRLAINVPKAWVCLAANVVPPHQRYLELATWSLYEAITGWSLAAPAGGLHVSLVGSYEVWRVKRIAQQTSQRAYAADGLEWPIQERCMYPEGLHIVWMGDDGSWQA